MQWSGRSRPLHSTFLYATLYSAIEPDGFLPVNKVDFAKEVFASGSLRDDVVLDHMGIIGF